MPETQAGGDDEARINMEPPGDDEPGGKRSSMRDLHQRELLGEPTMLPTTIAQATAEGGGRGASGAPGPQPQTAEFAAVLVENVLLLDGQRLRGGHQRVSAVSASIISTARRYSSASQPLARWM